MVRAEAAETASRGWRPLWPTVTPLSPTAAPMGGVLSSHQRRLGRVSERGFGRKADRAPMKGALLRRRERPVHGAGGRTGCGWRRQVRALRRVDRWEVWRGRGGRREERLCGSLAVRHEVLGVGPKHRLILEMQAEDRHRTRRWGRNRQKRKQLD